MKKISLLLITAAFVINFSYAQTNTFPSTGNVGIGTTSPQNLLHINSGAIPSVSQLRLTANGLGSLSALSYSPDNISLGFDVDYSAGWLARHASVAWLYKIESHFKIMGSSGNTIGGSATQNDLFDIDLSNGNVGIGTASPPRKLVISNSGNEGLEIGPGNLVGDAAGAVTSVYYNRNSSTFINNVQAAASHVFAVNGTIPAMIINSSGNIGIGTTTPDAKLAVNGTVHSKEVLVDMNIYPDYVFKPTYHLPTLTEVKTYIDKNHHLPDMPTEAEVVKNGLKVGETEVLLTKKVEELTLYIIEQNKRIEKLEKKLNHKK